MKNTSEYTILLYYKYVPIEDPESFRLDQLQFMTNHNIKGRILIAKEGINGTLEGRNEDVEAYIDMMKADKRFADVDWKTSPGTGNSFPKLKLKVRDEIVSAHLGDDDVNPQEITGDYMKPEDLHGLIHSDEEFYIIDMRNDYEQAVGKFQNSIDSGMKNFRDLPEVTEKFSHLKDKKVVTVCTGGIRCEKASGYLKKKGFKDVSQLHGGMHRYMEKFGGDGWLGSLYVFDGRVVVKPDSHHTPIGKCMKCQSTTEDYCDCANDSCPRQFLCCKNCLSSDGKPYCTESCEIKTRGVETK